VRSLSCGKFGDAVFAAQNIQHDVDLVFDGKMSPHGSAYVLHHLPSRLFGA